MRQLILEGRRLRPVPGFDQPLAQDEASSVVWGMPGAGRANEIEKSLVAGEYPGLWHGNNVKFIFEKVHPDGTFEGVIRFGKDTPWPDATDVFDGRYEGDGLITINRGQKPQPPPRLCLSTRPLAAVSGQRVVLPGNLSVQAKPLAGASGW